MRSYSILQVVTNFKASFAHVYSNINYYHLLDTHMLAMGLAKVVSFRFGEKKKMCLHVFRNNRCCEGSFYLSLVSRCKHTRISSSPQNRSQGYLAQKSNFILSLASDVAPLRPEFY